MQPQNITSFLDQNHLVVESDNQLFNFYGQRNLNRTAIASRAIKQGEIIYNIQPYSYTKEPNFLSVQISDQEHILDQLLEHRFSNRRSSGKSTSSVKKVGNS